MDCCCELLLFSQEISSHLSGLSEYEVRVSHSIVWTDTPIPAVTIPTILSPNNGEQQPAKWYDIPAVSPFNLTAAIEDRFLFLEKLIFNSG